MKDQFSYNKALLDFKRLIGDSDADEFIRQVFGDTEKEKRLQQWMSSSPGAGHLSVLKTAFPGFAFIETWAGANKIINRSYLICQ